jgi:hypothetical protein
MIKDILTAAGLEHAQGRYISKPAGTYAVYFDDIEVETADRGSAEAPPRIYHHDVTVEVYEPAPDDATEAAIEAELNARALPWTKQDRYWLKDSQQYQVIYETNYTIKRR